MPRALTAMPLDQLVDDYRRSRRSSFDPWVLAAQLSLLPDLRYLQDGLRRVRGCLERAGDEIEYCLRIVPGSRLDPGQLVAEIASLIEWIDEQNWAVSDPRMLPMARLSLSERHPLAGYCLSASHLWPLMFYCIPPDELGGNEDAAAYERLMDVFTMHVIAAQATATTARYRQFCDDWWKSDTVPSRQPYSQKYLGGRIAAASRVIRRMTLPEFRPLFDALAGASDCRRYHLRLQRLMKKDVREDNHKHVSALCLLLEDVVPGWRRPGDWSTRTAAAASADVRRGEARRTFADGYVRVSESPAIAIEESTDANLVVESFSPRPIDAKGRAKELIDERLELLATHFNDEETPARRRRPGELSEKEALALAEEELDGQEWLPVGESIADGSIEFVNLAESTLDESHARRRHGVAAGNTTRWAQDQRRRFHYAHRLTPARLEQRAVHQLLVAMMRVPSDSEDARALTCLHAAIATGRPFREGCRLFVAAEMPDLDETDERIRYVVATRQWLVPAPATAWIDMPPARSERCRSDTVVLDDQTEFAALLQHFDIEAGKQPVGRLTQSRETSIIRWTEQQLRAADQVMSSCANFLFHRLLSTNNGDIGIARLISGRAHSHSESVAHYAYYTTDVLQAAYQRAWRADGLAQKANRRNPTEKDGPGKAGANGARRVPTVDAVRTLIATLRDRMFRLDRPQRHDHYTAYTWLGCVLGLGMRPVVKPHIHEFASGTGRLPVVTFLDKARTEYHQRVNVLPDALSEHLLRYSQYLNECDRQHPMQNVPFRHFDIENNRFEAFRPGHFLALCSEFFDLELYALRRFVRTELARDPKLTAEDVDVFMGHWFDGVSPHDPLSTYPMMRQHGVARGAVTRMLKSVGFMPLWIDQGLR